MSLLLALALWVVACAVILYATVRAVRALVALIDEADEATR